MEKIDHINEHIGTLNRQRSKYHRQENNILFWLNFQLRLSFKRHHVLSLKLFESVYCFNLR